KGDCPPASRRRVSFRRQNKIECERSIDMQALYAQLLVGLINGSFYALLSLGLAVIFGMLNIINFAHGALYMMGAFVAFFLLNGVDVPTMTSILNGSWLTLLDGMRLPLFGSIKLPPL